MAFLPSWILYSSSRAVALDFIFSASSSFPNMTTPAGYIAFHLTGAMNLGVGEAAGMFPIDQSTMSYNEEYLAKFDDCLRLGNLIDKVRPIRSIQFRWRLQVATAETKGRYVHQVA